ncbi:MAG: ATP-binding cassette domain-containing protein [Clostridia bacterium]|nr:ATP-binding cassette domain-containing protein [Clostridia bacterium]
MENIIEIRQLNKTFDDSAGKVVALDDINISIRKGEIFGIIGLSGAGKSTLVRCINLLERPTRGQIIFDGQDLCSLSKKQLLAARHSMSMIFQSFNLLSQRTALQNVCFPLEITGVPHSQAKEKARELLKLVGLSEKEKNYPSQLSGGQKQRVAIARALATQPKVLLCDEATSALDPTTTQSILELLTQINQKMGVTIIVITHEMKVIEQICHRLAVVDQSHIVEMGQVQDVFTRPRAAATKQLLCPTDSALFSEGGKECLEIQTNDNETLISDIVLETHSRLRILSADIDSSGKGSILLRLPADPTAVRRIKAYLDDRQISYKEVNYNA